MSFVVHTTAFPDVIVFEPKVFGDDRGFFFESFNARVFKELTGVINPFVQDNHSKSHYGVLRGLHYQIEQPQGKLVRVSEGAVFDVAVDIRMGSATFGQWVGVDLSAENKRQLWIPQGFAHGFLVTSKSAQVLYKTTDYYSPKNERSIRWDDADIGINWPEIGIPPIVSAKDKNATSLQMAEKPVFIL